MTKINEERLLFEARNCMAIFCMEECNAYCCRKGSLILKENEVDLVTQNQREKLTKEKILKPFDKGKSYMSLRNGCPSLKDKICTIHKNKLRPQMCKDFPIYIEGKKLIISENCLAVKKNMLYPYIHQLLKLGYKLDK